MNRATVRQKYCSSLCMIGNLIRIYICGAVVGGSVALIVGCFRVAHDQSFARLLVWFNQADWWDMWIWGTILFFLALVIGFIVRSVPLIPGSGIPQTELILAGRLSVSTSAWGQVLIAKFAGSWLALMGGLSLGREGPCVQMGSAAGAIWGRVFGNSTAIGSHWIIAGSAAGLAAAFGAPIAGVVFVFEEMKNRVDRFNIICTVAAVFSAHLVIIHFFGLGRLFPFAYFIPPSFTESWSLLLVSGIMGLIGVFYTTLLLHLKDAEKRQQWLPQELRTLPALIVAGILAFTFPEILGGGDNLIRHLVTSVSLLWLLLFFLLKLGFSILSYLGNVPGGLLMPLLCIGALAGRLLGAELTSLGLVSSVSGESFILFGMIGMFAASVRAPLTGIALVLEMSGCISCLPGFAVVAFLASRTAAWLGCPPVYDALKARIVK